jgi:hypothetical protein
MPHDILPSVNANEDTVSQVRAKVGVYKDPVEAIPDEDLTLESSLPKAPDPKPFALGPLGRR